MAIALFVNGPRMAQVARKGPGTEKFLSRDAQVKIKVSAMWQFEVDRGEIATWIDGGIPSRQFLVEHCTKPYLQNHGISSEVLRRHELDSRSYRKSLSRIDLTETLACAYIDNYLTEAGLNADDYYLWITQPKDPSPGRREFRYMTRAPPFALAYIDTTDESDDTPQDVHRSDILHITPDLLGVRRNTYHQLIALHPYAERIERKTRYQTTLGKFANDVGFYVAPNHTHYRTDLYSDEVTKLLRELLANPVPREAIYSRRLRVVRHRNPPAGRSSNPIRSK